MDDENVIATADVKERTVDRPKSLAGTRTSIKVDWDGMTAPDRSEAIVIALVARGNVKAVQTPRKKRGDMPVIGCSRAFLMIGHVGNL